MSDIVEWLRNSNSDEWCSGQLLKAADEIQRLRTELKESRRLFVRDTDEYIKWTEEAKAEIKKLRKLVKAAYYEAYRDRDSLGDAGTDDPEDRCAWRLSAAAAAIRESGE